MRTITEAITASVDDRERRERSRDGSLRSLGMHVLRWVGFIAGMVVLALHLMINVGVIVRYYVRGKGGSMIPLLGGLAGALGLAISPNAIPSALWWIPPLIDPGCALLVVLTLHEQLRRRRS